MIADISTLAEIYSVSQLNYEVKNLLESSYPYIWVQGEISNCKRPGSGHMYFSLKDEKAQIRCAMFRMKCAKLQFEPRDGMHVLAQARVSLYEDRGEFQLIVEHMEETGVGMLQKAFEALKSRLAQEGLFDARHKKAIPAFPQCIGIVTSPTGAAVRDILNVLKRRAPHIPVVIYPTPVQGAEAAGQIVTALAQAQQCQHCDVLIVARGGGSLEDLWPFNEEIVARAIHLCPIPIISGVGHEIDFTIADFVADQRAPTPSAAAELVSPDRNTHLHKLAALEARFKHWVNVELRHFYTLLSGIQKRLQHPGRRLQDQAQRLDDLERHLIKAQVNLLREKQNNLAHVRVKLARYEPRQLLNALSTQQQNLRQRLQTVMQHQLIHQRQQLANVTRALDAVSPLNTLQRGYSITTQQQKIIRVASEITVGAEIETQLRQGRLVSVVKEIND